MKRRSTASGPLSENPSSSRSMTPPPVSASVRPTSSAPKSRSFFDVPQDRDTVDERPSSVPPATESRDSKRPDAQPSSSVPPATESRDSKRPASEPPASEAPTSTRQQKASTEPADDTKHKPTRLEQKDPGPQPQTEGLSEAKSKDTKKKVAKSKGEEDAPAKDRKRQSESKDDTVQDDRLHDDFFREGEEVEKENMALAHAGPVHFEDTGQIRLAKLRTSKEVIDRRRKMQRIVGYILAPAALVAALAGVKMYKNGGNPAKNISPGTTVSMIPRASATQPVPTADVSSVSVRQDAATDSDSARDAHESSLDAGPTDAPLEAQAVADASVVQDAAPESAIAPALPDGVDARKEALKALEQGKWARAEQLAQAAIDADPEDATPYLYGATALQEMGKRAEAKAVFQKCAQVAKRGPIHECRMFSK
ncbi:MAG TPA: hypothetical protein PLJ27_03900 [Polyangiaceae bacterium]|nr:hypothetical protein [Polyangiaceae bacterium]HOD20833.1 hypothetical protein [Polyangiaceae bacterium]HOE47253.1 hypothetical protein [Polyangiaceae bacterium]HOG99081.1 hypothetical protein [Polyangiaceae bacterium]HOR33468.1 hypothetical protein [Polyangiaceae bacterium]